MKGLSLLHFYSAKHTQRVHALMQSELQEVEVNYHSTQTDDSPLQVCIIDFVKKSELEMLYREQHIVSRVDNSLDIVPPLIPERA